MQNQIVILAAGKGKRMNHAELPKVLVPLAGRPIILYLTEELKKISGIGKPIVVVGHKHNYVKDVLGDNYIYAHQDQQLGTGHAVMCAESKVTAENILVLYGDMPLIRTESLKKLMRLHQEQQSNLSMFTATVNNFGQHSSFIFFGRIIRDLHGNIVKITEYKDASAEERKIREVNPGIYIFNAKWLFANIHNMQNKNAQGEYYLTDMVEIAIADGQKIQSLAINPKEVMGINSPEELRQVEKMVS